MQTHLQKGKSFFSYLFKGVFGVLVPPTCVVCEDKLPHEQDIGFCPDCWGQLPWLDKTIHPSLDDLIQDGTIDNVYMPLCYEGDVCSLISRFKYGDQPQLAKAFAPLMQSFLPPDAVLVPVPLHFKRLLKRRYNQAGFLAKELGRLKNIPVFMEGLKRVKATPRQVGQGAKIRRRQLKNAFQAHDSLKNTHVILVDDVLTTGATVKECAKMMKKVGAKRVDVLTLAYALPPYEKEE